MGYSVGMGRRGIEKLLFGAFLHVYCLSVCGAVICVDK